MFGLEDFLRDKLGIGQPYVSQKPENLGVHYKKFGPVSVMSGPATHESKTQALAARRSQLRTPQQNQSAPLKMYEDQSFQGDPREFAAKRPGFKFYEDNTFSAPGRIPGIPESPSHLLRQKLQLGQRPQFKKFEDGAMTWDGRDVPAYDSIDDFTTPRY